MNPPGHPEQVARIAAVEKGLAGLTLDRRNVPIGDWADVLRCHARGYVDLIREAVVPSKGWVQAGGDTYLSADTVTAALRAVGGVSAAVQAVLNGGAANAFVTCRPPGHHAEFDTAMGFCLFGTVAIGATRALEVHGVRRVAVLDFDVHHGNGTQNLLWDEARAMVVSSHQMPLYPGSGAASEQGAFGQIVNLPLKPGTGGAAMKAAWGPALEQIRNFSPELILISAGFDAHRDDPLGGLKWTEADFAWLTGAICDVADECCGGRVVSCLEGGYDLDALASSVAAHVGVLEERGR
jgi:acetoin utilization deacetylase AcuC-like enzyme